MTREPFDREIAQLQSEILQMGEMVATVIEQAVEALRQGDRKTARKIRTSDQLINEKRYEIENKVLTLIATQQPMARDLRALAAILDIIRELERTGDYAKGIARVVLLLDVKKAEFARSDFKQMSKIGMEMLKQALQAFINMDAEAARAIPAMDDQVDELYNKVYHKLMKHMVSDPSTIDEANHLMWAAHNLERAADRVTNICERIIFVVTGEMMEIDVSDDETISKTKPEDAL